MTKKRPCTDLHAVALTLETRFSVVLPAATDVVAFALLADACLALDLEIDFTTGVACADDFDFDTGFAVSLGCT